MKPIPSKPLTKVTIENAKFGNVLLRSMIEFEIQMTQHFDRPDFEGFDPAVQHWQMFRGKDIYTTLRGSLKPSIKLIDYVGQVKGLKFEMVNWKREIPSADWVETSRLSFYMSHSVLEFIETDTSEGVELRFHSVRDLQTKTI